MAKGSKWLTTDSSGQSRCWWCGVDPLYLEYHDREWGWPVADDARLFEKICLEGFQCGLSWLTILRKRPRFREVFLGFDPQRVVRMTERDVTRLVEDSGIVRHRGKILSTINNAARAIELTEEFGSLASFLWQFAEPPGARRVPRSGDDVPSSTPQSVALSRDLKRRGWSFVGPTTVHAFMQAVGMTNDHLQGCHIRPAVAAAQDSFTRAR